MRLRERWAKIWPYVALLIVAMASFSAFIYNVQHPELTEMQVLLAAKRWGEGFNMFITTPCAIGFTFAVRRWIG